jgi:hypothetical protein
MTDVAIAGEPFRIGTCLSKALSVYFANFVSFTAMGLLVLVPGFIVLLTIFGNLLAGLGFELLSAEARLHATPLTAAGFLAALIAVVALEYLLIATVGCGTAQYLQGNAPPAAAALAQGLKRGGAIIGLAASTTLLVGVGLLLLVVPGIVIALMFCVAVPVLMVEGRGVRDSLARSRELTRGLRWPLLGVFLAAAAGCMALLALVTLPFDFLLPQDGAITLVGAILEMAAQLFTTVFMAVVVAVAYHELRAAKDGVSTAELGAALA